MTGVLLEATGLTRNFTARRTTLFGPRPVVHAVDGGDLALAVGETLGLVGESGSGKSTVGRMLAGILPPSAGKVRFEGRPLADCRDMAARRAQARRLQLVFQDTLGALNPRLTVGRQVREVLDIHAIGPEAGRDTAAVAALAQVGLDGDLFHRFPHEISGGQRQRVVIARALVCEPVLLVCDEPVSALDVSVQAQVIAVLQALQAARGLAYLFISHDLRVVRQVCDRIAVMYLGRIVEQAPRDVLFAAPRHPYTRALIDAVPVDDLRRRRPRLRLSGEPPSPLAPPAGCRFHPRCAHAVTRCTVEAPLPRALAPGHVVSCHLAGDLAQAA